MGTLDPVASAINSAVSKIVDIDGMTRPQVKAELDLWLGRGWKLNCIYNEAAQTRAVFIKGSE